MKPVKAVIDGVREGLLPWLRSVMWRLTLAEIGIAVLFWHAFGWGGAALYVALFFAAANVGLRWRRPPA